MASPYIDPELERLIAQIKEKLGGPRQFFSILLGVLVLAALYSSFYTVEPDEEAVVIRLGKYLQTEPPGLHFKLPFIDRRILVKTTKVHQVEFGFRARESSKSKYGYGSSNYGHSKYSQANYDDESLMLTGDLNVAEVEWVVQYRISDPFKYLFKAAQPIQNIRDVSESIMRRVVGDKSVNDVLTTGRAEIAGQAKILMQEILNKYNIGIFITSVKLQDVNPPESVRPSFNEVNEAKQEQEKLINQAEKAYNKVIPEAKGKAEKLISEAQGWAKAAVNRASGDSKKFLSIIKEYKKAPGITRRRLYLETMEKIYQRFEKLTIVDPNIKGLLPVYQGLSELSSPRGLGPGGAQSNQSKESL